MGRYRRLKKKTNKSRLNIDFSEQQVEGYLFLHSSYSNGILSALMTHETKDLICSFIPIYNKRKRLVSRILKLVIERRLQDKLIEDSLLYKLYCNGFNEAFREIDKKIKGSTDMMKCPSIVECNAYIQSYINELDDLSQKPDENTGTLTFWEYLLELGKHEGAIVKGLLYVDEKQFGLNSNFNGIKIPKARGRKADVRTFLEMLSQSDKDVNLIIVNVREILRSKNTELYLAYLKIALEEENMISRCSVAAFHNALGMMYKDIEIVGKRGVQDEYRRLTEVMEGGGFVKNTMGERKSINGLKYILSN